jgi:hypothetical protein
MTAMTQQTRYLLARVSYWLLFVIAPSAALFFLLGASVKNGGVCLGTFAILAVIGEHGFRPWKRLWKVE